VALLLRGSAAIIVWPDRRFLLQHRNAKPGIWHPDSWNLFVGSIESDETLGRGATPGVG
jgi:hypothetical protein